MPNNVDKSKSGRAYFGKTVRLRTLKVEEISPREASALKFGRIGLVAGAIIGGLAPEYVTAIISSSPGINNPIVGAVLASLAAFLGGAGFGYAISSNPK